MSDGEWRMKRETGIVTARLLPFTFHIQHFTFHIQLFITGLSEDTFDDLVY